MAPLTARRAFTLVELLVVITVIGLLAALLLPVFAGARESGRRAACLSNERQLGVGIIQYTADNDSFFPNDRTTETDGQWALQTFPYIKDPGVFRCPDDPTTDSEGGPQNQKTHYSVDSYGINLNLLENVRYDTVKGEDVEVKPNVSEAVLTAPVRTVLLFEVTGDAAALTPPNNQSLGCAAAGNGSRNPSSPGFPFADGCRPDANGIVSGTIYATGLIGGRSMTADATGYYSSGIETTDPRHGDGANYLACDGHAVWLRPEHVSGGQSQPGGGADCGQDDTASACGGPNMAAGTANGKYSLTFSAR